MKRRSTETFRNAITAGAVITMLFAAGSGFADDAKETFFIEQVRPLLTEKCFACHGDKPGKIKGEFDMRTREDLLKGGESGNPAVVPGDPGRSPLYIAVTWNDEDLEMPPKKNDRLTDKQIAIIHKWITDGAVWSNRAASTPKPSGNGVFVKTSGGLSPEWTNRRYEPDKIWAYQPLQNVAPPGDGHPVDAFVSAAQKRAKITPAQKADKRTWLRRATFDLHGLPPTAGEADSFLNDESDAASSKIIDRLLASPRYGERMAQHWLDVARYADTAGFANDWERPNAWRYRDYVIRSFNADKPYDQFVIEQIAGDEIAEPTTESKIATGFLRMGPWEQTGMSVAAVTRQQFLDDVTNSVGTTFLAHSLRCARCHDHKFDPVPTRDYYSMQAIFASSAFADSTAPFLESEDTSDFDERRAHVERIKKLPLIQITKTDNEDSFSRINRKRNEYLKRAFQRFDPTAFAITNGKPEKTHILTGGSLESPGDAVVPAVMSAVSPGAAIPNRKRGRRLALARWITNPANPLTARVIVNRVWQWHFGTGLVATTNNFGGTGSRPTHPEMLDWLAKWFIDNGWSIKKLHRLIMTSETYARASMPITGDENNALLTHFRPRRLTAEEIRDATLFATGELSSSQGGPGVFPEINEEVALQPRHIMGSIAMSYQPSPTPELRNRRSVYVFRTRTLPDPVMEVFNKPGPDISCERRDETTVTPQVFALFNSQQSHDRALALAIRIEKSAQSPKAQVEEAFRLVFNRKPSSEQAAASVAHVTSMREHHASLKSERITPAAKVIREMIGEQSGELFRWEEQLLIAAIQRDLKPWDAAPDTRALAELCLVLLNSSEFLYVY